MELMLVYLFNLMEKYLLLAIFLSHHFFAMFQYMYLIISKLFLCNGRKFFC